MSSKKDTVLHELGIGPQWKLRKTADGRAETKRPEPGVEGEKPSLQSAEIEKTSPDSSLPIVEPTPDARRSAIARMDWPELKVSADNCRACALCKTRKQAVLGVGDVHADWLFVGEGPGAEEDQRGEPFVGQAGKLLDAMLAAIDIQRGKDVYIANSVKCRPPDNRTPEADEIAACQPYLLRQIALLKPKLIVALGRPAAQTLLGKEVKIAAVRGQLFEYLGIPLIVTYHPAYLLRNLPDKAKSWEDLVFARRTMQQLKGN